MGASGRCWPYQARLVKSGRWLPCCASAFCTSCPRAEALGKPGGSCLRNGLLSLKTESHLDSIPAGAGLVWHPLIAQEEEEQEGQDEPRPGCNGLRAPGRLGRHIVGALRSGWKLLSGAHAASLSGVAGNHQTANMRVTTCSDDQQPVTKKVNNRLGRPSRGLFDEARTCRGVETG